MDTMQAMVCNSLKAPLRGERVPRPEPRDGQVLVRVCACGVCRTDLQILSGDLPTPHLPRILGHEVIGKITELGKGSGRYRTGDRVGIPWLAWTCGTCRFCMSGKENLCEAAKFNGYSVDGGYAEYMLVDERFCFAIPDTYSDENAAPLL